MKPIQLTSREALNLINRRASTRSTTEMRDTPAERTQGKRKFGNVKVVDDGVTFDSKAEHRRWVYLQALARAKEITNLQRQVPFELIPAQVSPSGKKERATVYLADFQYVDRAGRTIVEDVKGATTPEYRLKRKLMLFRFGVEIQEVRC